MRARLGLVVLVVVTAATTAHAQTAPDAEVKAAFTAFVEDARGGKPWPSTLELLIDPSPDDSDPRPAHSKVIGKLVVDKPKVTYAAVVLSPGGASAWVAAELTAKVPRGGKLKKESLRASAVLAKEGAAWTVRAAHVSVAQKNDVDPGCGALGYEWEFEHEVPAKLAAPVKAVLDAFNEPDPKALLAHLSDDKKVVVFGSAPREKFVGGARVKGIFKKWEVGLVYWNKDEPDLPARAGTTADGNLLWMTAATTVPATCTSYRTLLVLAKEPAGWRIVHQHYSEPIYLDD